MQSKTAEFYIYLKHDLVIMSIDIKPTQTPTQIQSSNYTACCAHRKQLELKKDICPKNA